MLNSKFGTLKVEWMLISRIILKSGVTPSKIGMLVQSYRHANSVIVVLYSDNWCLCVRHSICAWMLSLTGHHLPLFIPLLMSFRITHSPHSMSSLTLGHWSWLKLLEFVFHDHFEGLRCFNPNCTIWFSGNLQPVLWVSYRSRDCVSSSTLSLQNHQRRPVFSLINSTETSS